jgi:hypothetical protein
MGHQGTDKHRSTLTRASRSNLRLPTHGALYAWEFQKGDRELKGVSKASSSSTALCRCQRGVGRISPHRVHRPGAVTMTQSAGFVGGTLADTLFGA